MASCREVLLLCFFYQTLTSLLLPTPSVASTSPTSLPGCPDKCGNITIPYPFGTRPGCCRDGFNITCNKSTTPPKAFLGSPGSNIELIDINQTSGEARVYKFIGYRCFNSSSQVSFTNYQASMDLANLPYLFSSRRNKFTAIGCYTLAYILGKGDSSYTSGCVSICDSPNDTAGDGGLCNGLGCCQTSIPAGLTYYGVGWGYDNNNAWGFNPCIYATLVEEDWYKFQADDLSEYDFLDRNSNGVPAVLDWAIRDSGTCQNGVEESPNPACLSNHSSCYNTSNGEGYLCNCTQGYEGNPYLFDGCTDIDECKLPHVYPCMGTCTNTNGSYECACLKGTEGDGKARNCTKIPEKFPYPARVATSCILGVAILLGLCFLVATHQQHKRHIKEKEEYQRYYQMMKTHLSVFSKKQIEVATNNFSETHVLGRGGQGNVYKALNLIENNQVVAIKKAKELVESQIGEFANEIILLSQINHKNIVGLLGCCLEDKIPMLVYEFVSNGTLLELLHGKSKTRPISLGTRLKIALDSAEALDYLHSSISRTILHGDVKSANILLENDYHAKVSDFGASNLVPNDDTRVVKVVQGSRGYFDPEYVATAVLTKKSDVYSFGVVLLELITRKGAIFSDETYERKHLASCFVSNANKNNLHEMLDKDIVSNNEKVIEVLQEVSKLAVWCLSVRGEDRPTMRQVVEKLQNLVRLHSCQLGSERVQEETESILGESTSYTTSDSYAFHSTGYSSVLEIETRVPR